MPKIKTYYDTLKVTRDAPANVIKAAYKTLCQTYHPDKYVGDSATADQMIKALSQSYAVLSDAEKRAEYDVWIAKTEKQNLLKQESESALKPKVSDVASEVAEAKPANALTPHQRFMQSRIFKPTENLARYSRILVSSIVIFSVIKLSSAGLQEFVFASWTDKLTSEQVASWLKQETVVISTALSSTPALNLSQSFLQPSATHTDEPASLTADGEAFLQATTSKQVNMPLSEQLFSNADLATRSSTELIWQCVAYNAHPGKIPLQINDIQHFLNSLMLKYPQLQANTYQQYYVRTANVPAMPAKDWKALKICANDLKNNLKKFAFLNLTSPRDTQGAVALQQIYPASAFSSPIALIEKCVAYNEHPERMPNKIEEIQAFLGATQWQYPELINLTVEPTLVDDISKPLRVCLNDLANQLKIARSIEMQAMAVQLTESKIQLH